MEDRTDPRPAPDPDAVSPDAVADDGVDGTGFASTSHRSIFAVYALAIGAAVAIMLFLLRLGDGLTAPTPEEGAAGLGVEEGHIDTHAVFWKLLLAIAVVIVAARLVGALFRRFGQPQVVGEIVAGVILGPTLLGEVWPAASDYVFNDDVMPFIEVFAQIGLVFFMFLVGAELDLRLIRGRGHAAALVSHASIIAPFLSGIALALLIFRTLGSPDGDFLPFALFLGASMSITAFPVLARILTERGLHRTRLGAVTITCAAIDDVTAWCILAVVVTVAKADGVASALPTVGWSVLFIAAMILVVRPLLSRLARHHEDEGRLSGTVMAIIFVGLVLSALATDRIGIHAIFGAFLFGAIMPQRSELTEELFEKLEDFSVIFLLPLFFVFSGLRTDVLSLGTDPQLWLYTILVLLVAVAGKWGGSALAARMVGMGWRDSLSLGILMNCRGLTELVILNIGLELGVIPPDLFSMLVIMALVTTFMTTPILRLLRPDVDAEVAAAAAGPEPDEELHRVLVHVASMENAYELVHTALAAVDVDDERIEVVLLRTLHLGNDHLLAAPIDSSSVDRARRSLRPLAEFVEGSGARVVTLAVQTTDISRAVIDVASERGADTVVLSSRRPFSPSALRRGTLGRILDGVHADVLVLIDPTGAGTSPPPRGQVLVPFTEPADRTIRIARHIARTHGATVRLVGTARSQEAATRLAARLADASGGITFTELGSDETVSDLLAAGHGADLVVLPLDGATAAGVVDERTWSTTPVLAIRDRAHRRPDAGPELVEDRLGAPVP
ncbi:MAG TPA: cation:proton antiporter [Acidimicrobiales bacterium]|nr:cation:proton antiporter [Acidimicrobiales bacterium]